MPRLKNLRRFVRSEPREQLALVRAAVLLLLARAALTVLPFRWVLRFTAGPPADAPLPPRRSVADLRRMLWAVDVVARGLFPRNPCLPQSIVAQRLLVRGGRRAELRIGVRKEGASKLEAHAWVESEGEVIGSRTVREEYVALPPIRFVR